MRMQFGGIFIQAVTFILVVGVCTILYKVICQKYNCGVPFV